MQFSSDGHDDGQCGPWPPCSVQLSEGLHTHLEPEIKSSQRADRNVHGKELSPRPFITAHRSHRLCRLQRTEEAVCCL